MNEDSYEDAPSTRLANAISECVNAVAPIASTNIWTSRLGTTTAAARKTALADALAALAEVAPLVELPSLVGPKDLIRGFVSHAADLARETATWDGVAPTAAMSALASGILAYVGVPDPDALSAHGGV